MANCGEKKDTGGWSSAFLLLANQGLATLAFFGVGVNLVLFFTRVLGQDNASAANNVSKWTGTVYLCSLVGAFLSDSYWGRYLTCAIFQVIFVLGLVLLSLSSWLLLLKPDGCGDSKQICVPTTPYASAVFYLAIYLVAFGYGGHQPTLATLGSDQFDESNPKQKVSKSVFFSYFYFALNLGSLFSNTVLVYYEDAGKWTLGFWAATASAVLALAAFLLGSPGYRYVKPSGNPVARVMQVFVAAVKKWNAELRNGDELYEIDGSESAIKGSRKICHTDELECLDKAAIITDADRRCRSNPWQLCTVTQVEEAKCIIRMLPIWLCTIVYSVVFTQMASLFVEQGDIMDTRLGRFRIPAASMTAFDILSVLAFTGIYSRVISPLSSRLGLRLTELHRMGIGLIIATLAMVAAGVTETQRLKRVAPGRHASSMSILWQIPQYVLVGASEVFMYVGQLDFFNGQAPDGVKSLGSSLCMASISLGNFTNSLLVSAVMAVTAAGGGPGWIPEDLNTGHMERFYFLVAGLTGLDFLIYLACAKWYKLKTLECDEEEEDEDEDVKEKAEREVHLITSLY
ncbi:protein nrt1/ ptr family 7.1 [Phtheirospermum japonicum]|uniref:Protein nrt1/ ptr family 7.1 n=1 Tax=Phtheirospermum japonicum TaxID=374723 RepID=A0A830B3U1_9LAMI|nr:protein nrt1/ ptr family 7.1 [Phtheirospermum japonicum]